MRKVTVAATQMSCTWDIQSNVAKAEQLVRQAVQQGAQIVLLQELFETPYFCAEQHSCHNELAKTVEESGLIAHFSELAKALEVVLPLSFFERAGNTRFNSLVVIDADGSVSETYRKMHIPQNPGYEEKYYFSPGDTGFMVHDTRYGKIGVGICWDQWFPEAARIMALKGAEMIFYPTAIGSEPSDPDHNSADHWRNVMKGHAAANILPVIASNRTGQETEGNTSIKFYGSSFITDQTGELVADGDSDSETVLLSSFDLDQIAKQRDGWGLFRDRRPERYKEILSFDHS